MANVYYGDGVSPATGNWNTASNWYSAVGTYACNCGFPAITPGTALGRVPNASTDTVYLFAQGDGTGTLYGQLITVTTGPTGGYSGAMLALPSSNGVNGKGSNFNLAAGSYSGTVNVGYGLILSSGSYSNTVTLPGAGGAITGGSFSGTVSLGLTSSIILTILVGDLPYPRISGGTFTGTVTRTNPCPNATGSSYPFNNISGGTYSPTATVTYNQSTGLFTAMPGDPGFSLGGGTFSPIITISNLPSGGGGIPAIAGVHL